MGCDIHMYCERKLDNGKWICADHFKMNGDDEYESKWSVIPIYSNRNYALFEVLAGVRAYYGNDPIDTPRGLPNNVCKRIKKASDRWGSDGHSHSWLAASELFEYKKAHPYTEYSGFISSAQSEALDNGILPEYWCQDTTDKTAVHRTWKEEGCVLDTLIEKVKERMAEEFYIWDFLAEEEKEEKYQKHADDFRIVFWFDN